jgi:hypothetical protein
VGRKYERDELKYGETLGESRGKQYFLVKKTI